MHKILGKQLNELRKSSGYVFTEKELPNQVFSKKFDKILFFEDVHQFDLSFFNQLKLLELNAGGRNIYLHTIEPYLVGYNNDSCSYDLNYTPPCMEFPCSESNTWDEVWGSHAFNHYGYQHNVIRILFGESGTWGYYVSKAYEIGIIGFDNLKSFKELVPYAFDNCFENFHNMLRFIESITDEEVFMEHKKNFIEHYQGYDI